MCIIQIFPVSMQFTESKDKAKLKPENNNINKRKKLETNEEKIILRVTKKQSFISRKKVIEINKKKNIVED